MTKKKKKKRRKQMKVLRTKTAKSARKEEALICPHDACPKTRRYKNCFGFMCCQLYTEQHVQHEGAHREESAARKTHLSVMCPAYLVSCIHPLPSILPPFFLLPSSRPRPFYSMSFEAAVPFVARISVS